MKRHVSGRPRGVAPTESAARRHMVFLLAFPGGKASHFRPVPPFSHRSKASVGDIRSPYGSTFRNSRQSVEGFSSYVIRAPGQASRLRIGWNVTFPGDHTGSPLRNPRRVGTWSFCSLFLAEKLHIFDQCLLFPTEAKLLWETYEAPMDPRFKIRGTW